MNVSFRQYYWRWLKNQIFLFILMAVVMTIARVAFAFYFGDLETLKLYSSDIKKALWLGFRFDLIPLAYINALPFIILNFGYLIPGKFIIRITRFLIISILCFGYFSLCWLYVFDYGFYSYFQEHLN